MELCRWKIVWDVDKERNIEREVNMQKKKLPLNSSRRLSQIVQHLTKMSVSQKVFGHHVRRAQF